MHLTKEPYKRGKRELLLNRCWGHVSFEFLTKLYKQVAVGAVMNVPAELGVKDTTFSDLDLEV